MEQSERLFKIQNARQKLDLINDMRNSFKNFDNVSNQYIYSKFNFSDVYEYFCKIFELVDLDTDKKVSFNDGFIRFFGLLQAIYVQQDLTDAIANVFDVNIKGNLNKRLNRDLRNELIGHPLSDERSSNECKTNKCNNNANQIKSTIILKSINSKSIHYISYVPENENHPDKIADIDSILKRHIDFLNESFDLILAKCFKELQRQVSKCEKYIRTYYNEKVPEIERCRCWFKQNINITSFSLDMLLYCASKKLEHKRYEVYLFDFEKMLIVRYSEIIDRVELFCDKIKQVNSIGCCCQIDRALKNTLFREIERLDAYFLQSELKSSPADFRDISDPDNHFWDIGYHSLMNSFSDRVDILAELNHLKMKRTEPIEYEISYRYIRFLLGYS